MNKKGLIYFVAVVLFSIVQANSQTTNYSTKKIGNTEYYIYYVQASEGLYSISKRFNVSQAEITEVNPTIASGLKPNQEILIPINSANKSLLKANNSNQTQTNNQNNYIEHTVLKKQTLFAISQTYKVDISDIQKANPQIINGLQEGMILNIPKNKKNSSKTKETLTKNEQKIVDNNSKNIKKDIEGSPEFTEHKVKIKETLYSIGKLYNITVDDILKYNPDAQENLRWGSKLNIIVKKTEKQTIKDSTVENKPKTNLEEKFYITRISKPVITNKTPIRIAFLLPFMLETDKSDTSNQRFIEFYSGALLAINEAKEFGVSYEIYTYDTGKSEEKMSEVLQNDELKKVDLIIGPAYTQQIQLVSNFALKYKINTLVPFSSKVYDININPYLLQFNPGLDIQVQFMAQILNKEYKDKDIIFCEVPAVSILDDGYEFSFELKNELKRIKRDFVTIDADSLISSTNNKLKNTKNTVLFFNTDKFSAVSNYIDSINSRSFSNKIELFKQLNWQVPTTNLSSFYISPFNMDVNNKEYKRYSTEFFKMFTWKSSASAPRFDIIGYDLTNYFTSLLHQNTTNVFNQKTKLPLSDGIQSNLQFERKTDKSGFINQNLYIFQTN